MIIAPVPAMIVSSLMLLSAVIAPVLFPAVIAPHMLFPTVIPSMLFPSVIISTVFPVRIIAAAPIVMSIMLVTCILDIPQVTDMCVPFFSQTVRQLPVRDTPPGTVGVRTDIPTASIVEVEVTAEKDHIEGYANGHVETQLRRGKKQRRLMMDEHRLRMDDHRRRAMVAEADIEVDADVTGQGRGGGEQSGGQQRQNNPFHYRYSF